MDRSGISSAQANDDGGGKSALRAFALVALAAGLILRLWLASIAPRYGYIWDHFWNIMFGRTASQHGLLHVYSIEPNDMPSTTGYVYPPQGEPQLRTRASLLQVNYPPLGETLFWLQSKALDAIDGDKPINTFTSRLVMSIASVLAELALAAGVFLVARRMTGVKGATAAAIICWLMPPLAMDSSLWGQTDSWFLAPAVFAIYFMLRRRWTASGLCMALSLMLKPQGIFLAPIAIFAAAIIEEKPGVRPRIGKVAIRLLMMGGTALVGAGLISLPWTLTDGMTWAKRAYMENVGKYPETTLNAFNVWYVDLLVHEGLPVFPRDALVTVLGVTKDTWGRILLLAALAATAAMCWRRCRRKPEIALVLLSAVWLWSTFIWPTQVHDRYIVYAIPLAVLAALSMKRLWPAVIVLAVVASFELCHNDWLTTPADTYGTMAQQVLERVNSDFQLGIDANSQTRKATLILEKINSLPPAQAQLKQEVHGYLSQLRQNVDYGREKSEGRETLLVIASLLAYAWMAVAPFVKAGSFWQPPPSDQPRRRSPPLPKTK